MKQTCRAICLILLGFIQLANVSAQQCDLVSIGLVGQSNIDFTYDTFSKYLGGITQNGATKLRVTVDNSINSNPDCRWNLVIYVENGSGATPNTDWETLYSQSVSGPTPTIDLVQLRVGNRCNTPLQGNQFFTIPPVVSTPIVVISNTGITIPAGSCVTNVNGPGNPTTHYDEYTFDIDYRIVPGIGLKSGIYQLRFKYVLTEVL
ncbi:MAG: hypothetical protein MUE96_06045 [Bacteroidia bacterium]|nr:hypothetical protein [Bacteroidia bacterium]